MTELLLPMLINRLAHLTMLTHNLRYYFSVRCLYDLLATATPDGANFKKVLHCEQFKQQSFVVMGPGQKYLTQVRLGEFFVAQVKPGQPSLVWVWIISPKNSNF